MVGSSKPEPDHPKELIYVAIRKETSSGKEWLDLSTASFHLEGCVSSAKLSRDPSWSKNNPVIGVARAELKLGPRKSWSDAREEARRREEAA